MRRSIGCHMRVVQSIEQLITQAQEVQATCAQFFFIKKSSSRGFYALDAQQIVQARNMINLFDGPLFLHSSFWVNLANVQRTKHPLLEREIAQARKIGVSRIVLHPGHAKGAHTRQEGITHTIAVLDCLLQKYPNITFVLENVAYAGLNIGGDLEDLATIAHSFTHEPRLGFCIDTSHAHAWGYDITSDQGLQQFIKMVDDAIGWSRVHLLHLNDTLEVRGSKRDVHCVLGDGLLGWNSLLRLACHPLLETIPVIAEMPEVSVQVQAAVIKRLRSGL